MFVQTIYSESFTEIARIDHLQWKLYRNCKNHSSTTHSFLCLLFNPKSLDFYAPRWLYTRYYHTTEHYRKADTRTWSMTPCKPCWLLNCAASCNMVLHSLLISSNLYLYKKTNILAFSSTRCYISNNSVATLPRCNYLAWSIGRNLGLYDHNQWIRTSHTVTLENIMF